MKQFNLEEALAGEPVQLRNGAKAFVLCNVNDYFKDSTRPACLAGIRSCINNNEYYNMIHWHLSGNIHEDIVSSYDIIGMWEDVIDIKDLPKAFMPKKGEIYYYIHPHETNFYLDVHETTFNNCRFDEILSNTGNCFRTKKDAQNWIDFMKSMKE